MSLHINAVCSVNILFDHIHFILADIACIYCSVISHFICNMETLSTRCCAHIYHIIPFLRICNFCHQHGAYILHLDFPLYKCIQCKNMASSP